MCLKQHSSWLAWPLKFPAKVYFICHIWRVFQISHTILVWMLPCKVAYVDRSLNLEQDLLLSPWLWQHWKYKKQRQISPCKKTKLFPLSREPAERSWDQYIPYIRLDLEYAKKCQGISLWISKPVIDLGCHSDI